MSGATVGRSDVGPWVEAAVAAAEPIAGQLVERLTRRLAEETIDDCGHIDPDSTAFTHWRPSRPETLLCRPCLEDQDWTPADLSVQDRCDLCGRPAQRDGILFLDTTVIVAALCNQCGAPG